MDDKIIQRCDREGVSLRELTRKFEGLFFADLDALNIVRARAYPRATEHIDEMAQFIVDLERNGLAYRSDEGSWYFSVDKKEGYGTRLVDLDPAQLRTRGAAAGGPALDADEYDAEKEGVRDFCLWKAYKPGIDREDATWDPVVEDAGGSGGGGGEGAARRLGRGRPGWHLECSAMARKYLGETIDLHAGGVDLKFPHHENEIAQSEVRDASGAADPTPTTTANRRPRFFSLLSAASLTPATHARGPTARPSATAGSTTASSTSATRRCPSPRPTSSRCGRRARPPTTSGPTATWS